MASPLPPQVDIDAAVDASPELDIVRAQMADAQAVAHLETSSAQPWVAKGGAQSRAVTGEPAFGGLGRQEYTEWDVSVEHGVRLPGKRHLDRSVAALELSRAEALLAETRRIVASDVIDAWYQCVTAQVRMRRAADEQKAGQELSRIMNQRLAAGDAASMDATLMGAERAALEAAAAGAAESLRAAQAVMKARGLPPSCDGATLNDAPSRTWTPAPPASDDPTIRLATAAAELAHARADRARSERHPDPAVGLRYAEERGGLEKIIGLYFTVPLPSGRARAEADHATALARVADSEQRRAEVQAIQRIGALLAKIRVARAQWEPLQESAVLQAQAAEQSWRAYGLGEGDLTTSILNQRAARAGRAATEDSLIEMWHAESLARLQVNIQDPDGK